MVIYVEYVIFDNFLLDLFIGLLTVRLLKLGGKRAIFSAIIGTILALIYPMVQINHVIIYKILVLFCCCVPFVQRNLFSLLKSIIIYAIISFVFSGGISLVLGVNASGFYSNGVKVGLISLCCIIFYMISYKIITKFVDKILNTSYLKVQLFCDGKKISSVGFVDSGNMTKASDGNGVIFLDKNLSRKIDLQTTEYLYVTTVSGNKIFDVIKIDKMMIYFDGQNHIYNNVNAVKTSQEYNGFQVLLSMNLKECQ